MQIHTTLEDVQYAAGICLKCGCCTYGDWPENHHLCSLFYQDECFTHGGGGFMSIVIGLAEDLLEYDSKIANLAYTCAGCLVCDSKCTIIQAHPPQVDMLDMIRLLRYEAVKRGLVPNGTAKMIHEKLVKPKESEIKSSIQLPATIESDKADTILFAECSHVASVKDISGALISLLSKVGEPIGTFSEQGCCGSTLYDFGFWDNLEPVIKANWEKMKVLTNKKFIFSNPHCQEFIVRRYPENLPDYTDINHQHISQLLTEALKNKKLKSKTGNSIKVSYHDPCYLGRGLGIYEPPREVLESLDGVELIEMTRNRKSSYCCGAKAVGNYFDNMSQKVAKERIEEFVATGADLLITACPYCRDNLQKALPDNRKHIVMDLVEFVDERTE